MNLFAELSYTLKLLLKNYWFTLLCASVLAIGIAIVLPFYVLVANLGGLQAPAFPDGESFVAFRKDEGTLSRYDAFHYLQFKENTNSFAELHAWEYANYSISDGDYAEAFKSAAVEPALLEMPQTQPLRGRLFTDADIQTGASPVAIISYDVWRTYYLAREDIIGLTSRINGEARTIVGVMPRGFRFPLAQDLWIPLKIASGANAGEGGNNLLIVGKLKTGVDLKQASDEVSLTQSSLLASWPEQYEVNFISSIVPYKNLFKPLQVPPQVLLTIFISLGLLVTFNIGNLFLARGEERLAELAIRGALGARNSQVAMTLLLESLLVSCCGLLLGWFLASFVLAWMNSVVSTMSFLNVRFDQLFWWDLGLNSSVLLSSAFVVLVVWLFSGGLPAWRLSRGNLGDFLAVSGKGIGDKGGTRLSKILVNIQLVISCLLLMTGSLQTLSYFSGTQTTTPDAEQLFVGKVAFAGTKLSSHAQQQQYLDTLLQGFTDEQGVEQAALVSAAPGTGGPRLSYTLEERDLKANGDYPNAHVFAVSPQYFPLFDLELSEGRSFNAGDTADNQPVIIIDQRLANSYWPNSSALGKRLQLNPQADATWYTVVGVSEASVQEDELDVRDSGRPVIYRPVSQYITDTMQAVVKVNATQTNPTTLLRTVASRVDRDVPIADTKTLHAMELENLEEMKFNRNFFAALIFIALFVSGIATYGMAARLAARRRIETGIRMAIGATRGAALMVFVKDGFRVVATGLSLGAMAGIAGSYFILGFSGVAGTFFSLLVPTALGIGLVLGTLVMLANYFPARKLVHLDPAEALRHE